MKLTRIIDERDSNHNHLNTHHPPPTSPSSASSHHPLPPPTHHPQFLVCLLSSNASEVLLMLTAVAAGYPAPLNALQILYANIVSAFYLCGGGVGGGCGCGCRCRCYASHRPPLPSPQTNPTTTPPKNNNNNNNKQVVDIPPCLALGAEEIEPDAMRRPPRRPRKAILGKRYTLALLLQAASMGLLGFAAYAIALDVEKLSETQVKTHTHICIYTYLYVCLLRLCVRGAGKIHICVFITFVCETEVHTFMVITCVLLERMTSSRLLLTSIEPPTNSPHDIPTHPTDPDPSNDLSHTGPNQPQLAYSSKTQSNQSIPPHTPFNI